MKALKLAFAVTIGLIAMGVVMDVSYQRRIRKNGRNYTWDTLGV